MSSRLFFTIIGLCVVQWLAGQDSLWQLYHQATTDTARVSSLQALAKKYTRQQPDSALLIARRAYQLAQQSGSSKHLADSYHQIGRLLYGQNVLDSAIHYYQLSIAEATAIQYQRCLADNYYHLANAISNQDKYEEAEVYYQKALPIYQTLGDEQVLMRFHINHAWLITSLGRYPEAAEKLYEAIRLAEKHGASRSIFNAQHELGFLKMQIGEAEEALTIFTANEILAEELGEDYKRSVAYGDLGFYYAEIRNWEKALNYDLKDLAIQEASGDSKDLALIYNNVGTNYMNLEQYRQAIIYFQKAMAQEGQHRDLYNRILATIQLGTVRHKLGQTNRGIELVKSALTESRAIQSADLTKNALGTLEQIYSESGRYQAAYSMLQIRQGYRDSLFDLEKNLQLAEIEAKFATEKKEKEIAVLEREAALAKAQRTSLIAILIGSILLASFIIAFLWQKRRLLLQQKAVAEERQRITALQNEKLQLKLSFKQQELNAKVLQLCKKNEFLQSLDYELATMDQADADQVKASSRKLTRQIRRDIDSDSEWDDFFQTFSAIHPRFLTGLQEIEPALSKSELRLASLLRMNLSSKEISQMLNISGEGVKKARYRLRKKLSMRTGDSLEQALLRIG